LRLLRREQRVLKPGELRRAKHRTPGVVGAWAGVALLAAGQHQLDVAIGAVVDIDKDAVPAPALREIELPGAVAAAVARRGDAAFADRLKIAVGLQQGGKTPGSVDRIAGGVGVARRI